MPKFTIKIADTITYRREATCTVSAKDEHAAEQMAERMTMTLRYPDQVADQQPGFKVNFKQEEIDNTPWETSVTRV